MKIFDWLKCDPECEHSGLKCWWDNSPMWRVIHSGPLWFLCSDCRAVRRG